MHTWLVYSLTQVPYSIILHSTSYYKQILNLISFISNYPKFRANKFSVKKVKVSHSQTAVGAMGVIGELQGLGTADERRNPPLSFCCLILPWFEKDPLYCWVDKRVFQSLDGEAQSRLWPSGDFLLNNRASLITRRRRLSTLQTFNYSQMAALTQLIYINP